MLGDQARRSVEQARQVRGRASLRILQRRAVAKPDEGEKLVQLAIAVHRQRLASQGVERNRVLGDDWRKNDAHAAILTRSMRSVQRNRTDRVMLGSRGGWCTISLDVARICGVWMRDAMARRYAYIVFAAATLAVALPLVHAQRASETASRPGASPAPKILVEKNIEARMRDGVVLRADVYRPDTTERLPALLQRTPYSKNPGQDDNQFRRLAARGYVVVVQDTRGRYMSDGVARPHDEGEDGYDTVEWAAKLPYVSGRVGTFGGSYSATTQLMAATAAAAASGRDVAGVVVSQPLRHGLPGRRVLPRATGCRGTLARAPMCGAARISRRSCATVRSA